MLSAPATFNAGAVLAAGAAGGGENKLPLRSTPRPCGSVPSSYSTPVSFKYLTKCYNNTLN